MYNRVTDYVKPTKKFEEQKLCYPLPQTLKLEKGFGLKYHHLVPPLWISTSKSNQSKSQWWQGHRFLRLSGFCSIFGLRWSRQLR